ncbi:MAG: hypothetical protein K2P32_04550, partial [Clostridia bacterium]|nr:hypothetical protein [Clostridia bacterium]
MAGVETKPTMTYKNGILSATEIGVYTVTCSLKSGFTWSDGSVNDKTYIYKIVYRVREVDVVKSIQDYNGEEQEFSLRSYDKTEVTIETQTNGLIFDDSGTTAVFRAKNATTYSAVAKLKDPNLMEWTTGGSGNKTLSITINKAVLGVEFLPDTPWSWTNGEEKEVSVVDDRRNDKEKLSFRYYYVDNADTSKTQINVNATPDDGSVKKSNIKLLLLTNGNYTLYVELLSNGDGNNYTLDEKHSKTFNVTNPKIDITYQDILWQYQNLDVNGGQWQSIGAWDESAGNTFELAYNAKEYTFGIDESTEGLRGLRVKEYKNERNTTVGNVTTSVTLEPINASSGTTVNGGTSVTYSIR